MERALLEEYKKSKKYVKDVVTEILRNKDNQLVRSMASSSIHRGRLEERLRRLTNKLNIAHEIVERREEETKEFGATVLLLNKALVVHRNGGEGPKELAAELMRRSHVTIDVDSRLEMQIDQLQSELFNARQLVEHHAVKQQVLEGDLEAYRHALENVLMKAENVLEQKGREAVAVLVSEAAQDLRNIKELEGEPHLLKLAEDRQRQLVEASAHQKEIERLQTDKKQMEKALRKAEQDVVQMRLRMMERDSSMASCSKKMKTIEAKLEEETSTSGARIEAAEKLAAEVAQKYDKELRQLRESLEEKAKRLTEQTKLADYFKVQVTEAKFEAAKTRKELEHEKAVVEESMTAKLQEQETRAQTQEEQLKKLISDLSEKHSALEGQTFKTNAELQAATEQLERSRQDLEAARQQCKLQAMELEHHRMMTERDTDTQNSIAAQLRAATGRVKELTDECETLQIQVQQLEKDKEAVQGDLHGAVARLQALEDATHSVEEAHNDLPKKKKPPKSPAQKPITPKPVSPGKNRSSSAESTIPVQTPQESEFKLEPGSPVEKQAPQLSSQDADLLDCTKLSADVLMLRMGRGISDVRQLMKQVAERLNAVTEWRQNKPESRHPAIWQKADGAITELTKMLLNLATVDDQTSKRTIDATAPSPQSPEIGEKKATASPAMKGPQELFGDTATKDQVTEKFSGESSSLNASASEKNALAASRSQRSAPGVNIVTLSGTATPTTRDECSELNDPKGMQGLVQPIAASGEQRAEENVGGGTAPESGGAHEPEVLQNGDQFVHSSHEVQPTLPQNDHLSSAQDSALDTAHQTYSTPLRDSQQSETQKENPKSHELQGETTEQPVGLPILAVKTTFSPTGPPGPQATLQSPGLQPTLQDTEQNFPPQTSLQAAGPQTALPQITLQSVGPQTVQPQNTLQASGPQTALPQITLQAAAPQTAQPTHQAPGLQPALQPQTTPQATGPQTVPSPSHAPICRTADCPPTANHGTGDCPSANRAPSHRTADCASPSHAPICRTADCPPTANHGTRRLPFRKSRPELPDRRLLNPRAKPLDCNLPSKPPDRKLPNRKSHSKLLDRRLFNRKPRSKPRDRRLLNPRTKPLDCNLPSKLPDRKLPNRKRRSKPRDRRLSFPRPRSKLSDRRLSSNLKPRYRRLPFRKSRPKLPDRRLLNPRAKPLDCNLPSKPPDRKLPNRKSHSKLLDRRLFNRKPRSKPRDRRLPFSKPHSNLPDCRLSNRKLHNLNQRCKRLGRHLRSNHRGHKSRFPQRVRHSETLTNGCKLEVPVSHLLMHR